MGMLEFTSRLTGIVTPLVLEQVRGSVGMLAVWRWIDEELQQSLTEPPSLVRPSNRSSSGLVIHLPQCLLVICLP